MWRSIASPYLSCGDAHPSSFLHLPPAHQEVIKVIQPVVLGKMIRYFEDYDPDNKTALNETFGYAAALSICTIGLALLHHLYFYHVQRTGMKIRVAMCHMIYKKVSERAPEGEHNISAWLSLNALNLHVRGGKSHPCILVWHSLPSSVM